MSLLCHINLAGGYRGGEIQTGLLVSGVSRWGLTQRVVVRRGGKLAGTLRGLPGVEVREVGGLVGAVRALSGASVVHAHEARAGHAAHWNRVVRGTPYVLTRRVDNRPKRRPGTRSVYRRADHLIALSRGIAKVLRDFDATLTPQLIPDAVRRPAHIVGSLARLRAAHQGKFVVGNVAALDHSHKGQRSIIRLAREMARTHPQILFVLVGGGRDEKSLKRRARGLANVLFTGPVDNVGDYLAWFDVFLYPSLHEGLGSALLEAMHFSLPIVATRVGGIPDVVTHESNGVLIEPENTDQMRFAILRLFGDEALRKTLGARGLALLENYTAELMTERYIELYQPYLAGSGWLADATE